MGWRDLTLFRAAPTLKFVVNPAVGQLVERPRKDSSKIIVWFIQIDQSLKAIENCQLTSKENKLQPVLLLSKICRNQTSQLYIVLRY
jgi:hypothetical protein